MAPMDLRSRQEEFIKRVESIIGNFQHATIQRSEQKPSGMVDIYSDLFILTNGDDDELQIQECDEEGNPIPNPRLNKSTFKMHPMLSWMMNLLMQKSQSLLAANL